MKRWDSSMPGARPEEKAMDERSIAICAAPGENFGECEEGREEGNALSKNLLEMGGYQVKIQLNGLGPEEKRKHG